VLDVDLGWNVWIHEQHCRLLGIDAPERYTDAGKRSKDYMEAIIGTELTIKTDVDKTCSFKRMLVTLFRDGRNLNDQMVESGNATQRE